MTHYILVPSCDLGTAEEPLEGTYTLKRLEKAYRVWKKGDEKSCFIVLGGYSESKGANERHPARYMAAWLAQQGVPHSRIVLEDSSMDTYKNIEFSLRKIGLPNMRECALIIVTERNQIARFKLSPETYRPRQTEFVDAEYELTKVQYLLEKVLYAMHWLDRRGNGPLARLNRWMRHRAASK